MIASRRYVVLGRAMLIVLMVVTLLPFVSMFTTALHAVRDVPVGARLAVASALGQLLEGVRRREHGHPDEVERC